MSGQRRGWSRPRVALVTVVLFTMLVGGAVAGRLADEEPGLADLAAVPPTGSPQSGEASPSTQAPAGPPTPAGTPGPPQTTAASVQEAAGLLDPDVLTPSPTVTVTEDGAVVADLDVSGVINVRAEGVTIRNVRVRTDSSSYGINVQGGAGTVIEHVEIEMGVSGGTAQAAIGGGGRRLDDGAAPGDNVIVRNSRLLGNADGIKVAEFGLYEGNVIQMRRSEGSKKHIDGIQASGRSHWVARRNVIDQAYSAGHNAAIFQQAYTGKRDVAVSDVLIEENWVNGGVYTIVTEDGKDGRSGFLSSVMIRGNVFQRDYLYGVFQPTGAGVTGDGGTWADTGEPVPKGRIDS